MSNQHQVRGEDALASSTSSSNQSGSNDFVKKLFQMLQDDNYKDVVQWTTNGDSFVVLDTNEFTKDILPRHFKHSNFASFVRQLNKYDFHKVKVPNEEKQSYQYGEDAWEFRHPDFRINDRESLENIKRKGPSSKKGNIQGISGTGSVNFAQYQGVKEEMDILREENKSLHSEISVLHTKYKALIDNIVAIRNFDERYYRSMSLLINCLTQAGIKLPPLDFPNPAIMNLQQPPIQQPSTLQHSHQRSQSKSHSHTHSHSHSGSISQLQSIVSPPHNNNQPSLQGGLGSARYNAPYLPQPQLKSQLQPISHAGSTPTNDVKAPKTQSPTQFNSTSRSPSMNTITTEPQDPQITSDTTEGITTTNLENPKFHILLVEDDNVCIQLCRKFLVKYGCQVTVVTDGLNAISTVENTRYDLVLMDIVMPNLDGATATSVIRSFDTKTPIIAMTGNIENNDLVTYLQNGMSDILAKPFTKDDLYSILSKYLLTVETKPKFQNLQGPSQQNLVLPHEQSPIAPTPSDNGDQVLKKPRLS